MKLRRWLVAGMVISYVATVVVSLLIGDPAEVGYYGLSGIAFLAAVVVGGLIVVRQPGNGVGLLFCVMGLAFAAGSLTYAYRYRAVVDGLPGLEIAAWLAELTFIGYWTPAVMLLLVFPTGHLPSPRLRPLLIAILGCVAVTTIGLALGSSSSEVAGRVVTNPFAAPPPFGRLLLVVGEATNFGIILLLPLAAAALVIRMRRAQGVERQQLKWFVYAASLIAVAIAVAVVLPHPLSELAYGTSLMAAGGGLPIAAGIAILRHRLYDIDLLINRTLVYGALTLILGALYVTLVLGLQLLVSPFTGNETLSVAISTLAIAALFGPVRGRVQAVVDRRFYRSRYDAHRTVEAFAARLRDEVDLDSLVAELQAATRNTVRPTSASVWLRESAG